MTGERVDHPHHAGMWFNYGNVNGFDFWNNSDAIKPENRSKMGSIDQEKILSTKSGRDQGELVVESVWITGTGEKILDDTTRYVFTARRDARVIDQITTLKALDHIVFDDDKEGLLGIRVASWLESPTEKGGVFADANGTTTKVADAGSPGASGIYLTSEGKRRRSGVGNPRALVHPGRFQGRPGRRHRNPRPPGKSGVSHVLARPRLRIICRQSAGPEDLRSEPAGFQLHHRQRSDDDVSLPDLAVLSRCNPGRNESRGRRLRRGLSLARAQHYGSADRGTTVSELDKSATVSQLAGRVYCGRYFPGQKKQVLAQLVLGT